MGVHRVALRLTDGRVIEPVMVSGANTVARLGDEPNDGSLSFDAGEVADVEDRSECDYEWIVAIDETAAGTYRVHVEDRLGRSVELTGRDLEALRAEALRQVASLSPK
jgi:hypothetical protein